MALESPTRVALVALAVALHAAPARGGESGGGVSPSVLSLPSGPGSLEGVGENVEPNINMGLASYGITVEVPSAWGGLAPSVRLAYGSGGGASIVGMGWSLDFPTIERMTSRGLPRYDALDLFAANGGAELVYDPDSDSYRERYEGGFVRYRWIDPSGDGRGGYWTAEYPDGRVGYFGGRANGNLDPGSRVEGSDGVFRYHLAEMVDVFDHRIRYEYVRDGATALPSRVSWGYGANGVPRYEVRFAYEDRPDHISDGKPGFELRLTKRLVEIDVRVRGVSRRTYELLYQLDEDANGLTKLDAVYQYGLGGAGPHPIAFRFRYSDEYDPRCPEAACRTPYVATMTSVGVDFATGRADLIDLNGDALPDVVDTSDGIHRIHLNDLTAAGDHRFRPAVLSDVARGGSARLDNPNVQMVDLDGDGFTDLVDGQNGRVYWNRGEGDWEASESYDNNLPDFGADANLRFFDYDNDKAIDLIHTDPSATWFVRNLGDGRYASSVVLADEGLERGFFEDGIQMADMNGDGLQDATLVLDSAVAYRMNLGWGRFADWTEMFEYPSELAEFVQFTDVNGDSLSDALVVLGDEVSYALNRNGLAWGPLQHLTSADVDGDIPERTPETSVRLADMNGNGSTDVVWITSSGLLTYLELTPIRPNLLTWIDNGIGKVIEMSYGTSVEHMVRDGGPTAWEHRLPQPHRVLERLVHYDTLQSVRQVQDFAYHDGYYDGAERQFRGFERAEVLATGDSSIDDSVTTYRFDVGDEDPYRHGKLLVEEVSSGNTRLVRTERFYDDCAVGGVSEALEPPVRSVCEVGFERTIMEGQPEEDWVSIEEAYAYDAYGNRTLVAQFGVTSVGGGACDVCSRDEGVMGTPCGMACLGDETYAEITFVSPDSTGGRWLLQLQETARTYGIPGGPDYTEMRDYYDGEPFVGLPLGQANRGLRMRREARVDGDAYIATERFRYDSHGNPIEELTAEGRRQRVEYDADGLLPIAESHFIDHTGGSSEQLRMEVAYDPVIEKPVEVRDWSLVDGLGAATEPAASHFTWDAFARLSTVERPGDAPGVPGALYTYDLGDPVSRIVTQRRSQPGGQFDLEEVLCLDGESRVVQRRTRLDATRWQVSGYTMFNSRGAPLRNYAMYEGDSGRCDRTAPAGVTFNQTRYDGQGRPLVLYYADEAIYGAPSRTVTRYGPLEVRRWEHSDEGDENNTPDAPPITIVRSDGLSRTTAFVRVTAGGAPVTTELTYDALGNLRGYVDAEGNEQVRTHDALNRLVVIDDPDSGRTELGYDDDGNVVARTDARGVTTRMVHDGLGRVLAQWDDADPAESRISYTYDRPADCDPSRCSYTVGRQSSACYPVIVDEGVSAVGCDYLGYDVRGRPSYTARWLDGTLFEFDLEYDGVDRLVRLYLPDGNSVSYRYNGMSRVTAVPGYITVVDYDERGLMAGIEYANGVRVGYAHDAAARLASIEAIGPGGDVLQDLSYAYDRRNQLLTVSDGGTPAGQPSHAAEFEYDEWRRLTHARLDLGETAFAETLELEYNLLDDLISKTSDWGTLSPDHVGEYTYGEGAGPHAVTRAGDVTFGYDAAGYMIRNGQETYSWDFLGRLSAVERDGQVLAQFAYGDGQGRVLKVEGASRSYYLGDDYEIRDGVSTFYVRAGNRRVAKIERVGLAAALLPDLAPAQTAGGVLTPQPDGSISAADAYLAMLAESGAIELAGSSELDDPAVLLQASAQAHIIGSTQRVTWMLHDHAGSTAVATDENGQVVLRTQYYPFGMLRFSNQGYQEDYGYTGREHDESTGLTYFGARYLDPWLGRWTSPDAAMMAAAADQYGDVDAFNRYAFLANNPIGNSELGGHRTIASNFNRNGDVGQISVANVELNYQHMIGFMWRIPAKVDEPPQPLQMGRPTIEQPHVMPPEHVQTTWQPVPKFEARLGAIAGGCINQHESKKSMSPGLSWTSPAATGYRPTAQSAERVVAVGTGGQSFDSMSDLISHVSEKTGTNAESLTNMVQSAAAQENGGVIVVDSAGKATAYNSVAEVRQAYSVQGSNADLMAAIETQNATLIEVGGTGPGALSAIGNAIGDLLGSIGDMAAVPGSVGTGQ